MELRGDQLAKAREAKAPGKRAGWGMRDKTRQTKHERLSTRHQAQACDNKHGRPIMGDPDTGDLTHSSVVSCIAPS